MTFEEAQNQVNTLSQKPDTDTLLSLYGLYKQASQGDAVGKRPGVFDVKGRAKFDAWAALEGTSQEEAAEEYVSLVEKLLAADK